jgi:chemotaxis protein CheZ
MSSIPVEREDWDELIRTLKDVETAMSSIDGDGDVSQHITSSHQALQGFHTTAAMLGLGELEHAGLELEHYLSEKIQPSRDAEALSLFGFALNSLLDAMKNAEPGQEASAVQSREITEILSMTPDESPEKPEAALTEPAPEPEAPNGQSEEELMDSIMESPSMSDSGSFDLSRLEQIVANLGGKLTVADSPGGFLTLRFNAVPAVVEQLETLLAPNERIASLAGQLSKVDNRLHSILDTIKDFLAALADRDMIKAENILMVLAEQQHQAGLYNEIGSLARELHNSLRNFMDTMDPALREIVEDKIPDYGSRLEHILEVTENAATVTLDNVEIIQKRNDEDQKELDQIKELLGGLRSIGEQARKKLDDSHRIIDRLQSSAAQTHDDLITILTAQDYQDLTGQVIMKIIKLLKDLELKLVNVIRTFGVRVDGRKDAQKEELYGPAHKGTAEALHSQDDVDNLLAEFGF